MNFIYIWILFVWHGGGNATYVLGSFNFFVIIFAFCVCVNLYEPILVFAFVWQGGAVQHIPKSAGLTHFVIIDRPCPSFVKLVVFRVKLWYFDHLY